MLPSAHRHLHSFSHIFAQLTAACHPPRPGMFLPLSPYKLLLCMGDLDPNLTHGSLSPSEPTTKPHIDRFSFTTVSSGMPGHVLSPSHGDASNLIHASLGPPESITQTASRSVQPFLHSSRQCRDEHLRSDVRGTMTISPSHGRTWTLSNTWFLQPARVVNPNSISIRFCRANYCDRQTDRPHNLVCNNKLYLRK